MKRTTWSVIVAVALAVAAVAVLGARRYALGEDIDGPRGGGAWKVGLLVTGRFTQRNGTLTVRLPPDFRRQHLVDAEPQATGVVLRGGRGRMKGSEAVWDPAAVAPGKPQDFRLAYSFRLITDLRKRTPAMAQATRRLDGAPSAGEYLAPGPRTQSDAEPIRRKAQELAGDEKSEADLVRRLYDHVREMPDEPALGALGALECLERGAGDSGGKSRLLVALCRNRGVPARLVAGLILGGAREQRLHHWAEAWVGHWMPMDATYGHFGATQFPGDYLVLHLGDDDAVQARGGEAHSAYTVHKLALSTAATPPSGAKAFWMQLSLFNLRPAEQQLVKFLLLLPLAALIVCIFRTVIGVPTFGTFSPALLGLAFLDLRALPWALGAFVLLVLCGWTARRALERFHLLLVPRIAALLTLIVAMLIAAILGASHAGLAATGYISLFPLVILTHIVERFWTVEAEDGTEASFRTLMYTLAVAATVSLALAHPAVANWMFRHPETLGVVFAAQLLLGRYTGYRLSELFRFNDLAAEEELKTPPPPPVARRPEKQTAGGAS